MKKIQVIDREDPDFIPKRGPGRPRGSGRGRRGDFSSNERSITSS